MSRPAPRSLKVGLVPFLFGAAQTDEIPGVALTRLLGDLGMTQSAARGQLARMRRSGQLSASRRGARTRYRLAGPFAASFRRVHIDEQAPSWDGYFHGLLYQVPESSRSYRDRLRRAALLVGYGILQQGVLIAVEDHTAELTQVLSERPSGCEVYTATIGMDTDQAAQVALAAWDLREVDRSLRRHIATLEGTLRPEGAPPPSATTLRRFAELFNAPSVDLLRDPDLPSQLLPPEWCRPKLDALMRDVRDRYQPPVAVYVRSVIDAAQGKSGECYSTVHVRERT